MIDMCICHVHFGVSFSMVGPQKEMGQLSIKTHSSSATEDVLWTRTKPGAEEWNRVIKIIPLGLHRIVIEAEVKGSKGRGDIAIDDVEIYTCDQLSKL